MVFSTFAINAVNRVSGGKRLFLASLQQTCNEYLYLNINKRKLAFLLQKSSGDFLVIWLMFSIFFHVLHIAHVLQTYFMFSHPGWHNGTTSAALLICMIMIMIIMKYSGHGTY